MRIFFKIFYIIFFSFILFFSTLYGQEEPVDEVKTKVTEEKKEKIENDNEVKKIEEKKSTEEKKDIAEPAEEKEKAAVKKKTAKSEENSSEAEVESGRKIDKVNKPAPVPVRRDQKAVDGLLDVLPGNGMYARIPGITFDDEEKKEEEIIKIPDEAIQEGESSKDESEGEGLFGFSDETTEIIAKVSILLLILFIFILYKTRSRGSSRKVLNRYPKK